MRAPPPPKEPSGCIQSLIISRMMLQIMFVPLMLILGAIVAVLVTLYAFAYNPLLGFVVLVAWVLALVAFAKWEWRRVGREFDESDLPRR